jgi:hypothetical protein
VVPLNVRCVREGGKGSRTRLKAEPITKVVREEEKSGVMFNVYQSGKTNSDVEGGRRRNKLNNPWLEI